MGDVLGSSLLWQIVAAVGTFVAVYQAVSNRQRRALTYEVLAQIPIARVRDDSSDKIQVLYDGQPVQNVFMVVVQFRNDGNVPIRCDDYEEPLVVWVPRGRILAADLAEGMVNLAPAIDEQEAGVKLSPRLLNPKDEASIRLLIADYGGELKIHARIVGVTQVRERSLDLRKVFRFGVLMVSFGTGVLALLAVSRDIVMSEWSVWLRLLAGFAGAASMYRFLGGSVKELADFLERVRKGLVW